MTNSHLILFDCDGTLVDSHHHIIAVMQQTFAKCGLPVPDDAMVAGVIGLSLDEAIFQLRSDINLEKRKKIADTYRGMYRDLPDEYGLHTGVRPTLITLQKRGYWLSIVTGKSLPGLHRVLDKFDLSRFFMVWRTADQCPSKPHPDMVTACMEDLGVDGGRTTVVGDACVDMQMAVASGVRGLGAAFGAEDACSLKEAGAANVVDNFPDLLVYFPHLRNGQASSTMPL